VIDLHNHTPLCNHATGEPREYIKEAIKKSIKIYGFSDHAPMEFDKKYRMSFDQMEEYEKEILDLKKEFKEKIDIRLGYEVDFIKKFLDKRVLEAKVDYLIGSIHFLDGWGFDNPEFIGEYKNKDIDKIWEDYFLAVEEMAKSGHFQIVGHLDLIKVFNYFPKKDIRIIAKNAIKAIKKANMTVEINSAGFRKDVKKQYPQEELLEMIYEYQIPITFGSDAHKIEDVGYKLEDIINLAKKIGFKEAATYHNKEREMVKI